MGVGSNSNKIFALMGSNTGASCGGRVSSIAEDGFPDESPQVGPECTEIGNDTDLCIPPMIASVIARFATTMTAMTSFPQKFTDVSCSSQGFNTFNRKLDVSSKVPNFPGLDIPTKIVSVYRK